MPMGIPKLANEPPKKPKSLWRSLYDNIYQEGFIFLYDLVLEKNASQAIGLMIYLNMRQPDKNQFLFINCPGGYILPGMGVYDTMQALTVPVHTICLGLAASLGCYILSGGAVNSRIALAHAKILIHQPMGALSSISPLELYEECSLLIEDIRKTIIKDYAQRTGRPECIIELDMERDTFMTPIEAKDYGILDCILSV